MTDANDNEKTGVGLPVGTKIGKYEVRERLGAGGQAIVYRCYDPLLDRDVAIKQISSHLAEDPKFMARFRKEAQILARLGGEVIAVHELIEDERGLFIVMEYVEGHSLETILHDTNGPVEVKATLQILWRLAATLNEVHSAGVVHRDLKPANIIIAEGLHPRITDFGVAAGTSGQTSMVLGTTKYLAPEVYEGGVVDARCDIYSLGFILYEMLAGRPRFNEIFHDVVRDPHSAAMRWMKWHGNRHVTAPPLSEINPDVPEAMSDIVAKMMAKDPDERFESTEALGRAIKSSFSPKARAAAAAQAAETKLVREGRRAVRGKAPAGAEEGGLAETGDGLELGPEDAAATAPLPKPGLSMRTKLILAGVIAVSFVAAVTGLVLKSHLATTEIKRDAKALYNEANVLYEDSEYAKALDVFEKLGDSRYRGTQQADKASVMRLFCKARLAVIRAMTAHRQGQNAKPLWEEAGEQEEAAKKRLREVQARRDDKEFEEWARERSSEIKGVAAERTNARDFVERVVRAGSAFAEGKFAQALQELDELIRTVPLLDPQREEARILRRKIVTAELKADVAERIAAGEKLAEAGKLVEAERTYRLTLDQVGGDSAGVLTPEERKAYRDDLEARIRSLQARQSYDKLMAEAEAARRDGDRKAELDALKKAQQKRPSTQLASRILSLESDLALQRGREILSNEGPDYLAKARLEFEKAVKLNGNPAAKAELEALVRAEKRKVLIAEADSLAAAGKFDDATKKYQEASKLGMDQSLTDKMADCLFRGHLSRAESLRKAKKFEDAAREYRLAAEAKPEEQARIDAEISAMQQQERYDKNFAAGDAALKARKYSEARDHFRKAKEIMDTPEVQERLVTVTYSEYLDKGKAAMSEKRYRVALANFKLARKYRPTDEVKKLIAEAERLLKETSSGETRLPAGTREKKATRKHETRKRFIILRLSL